MLHCQQSGCEFCSEECPLARTIKTAQPVDASGFLQHKSGYEVPVRIRAVPVHNLHGSIIGAVETFEELEQSGIDQTEKTLPGGVDDATGVANATQTKSHLREALAAFAGQRVAFSVLRFRIQRLDQVRGAFGPDAASSLLRVIARSLGSDLWRKDVVGRWSEDEFLVILNGCDGLSLPAVRERLRHMLANASIEWWGERRSLPVSIGETTARTEDTIESILERTEKSLDHTSEPLSRATTTGQGPSPGS